MITYDYSKSNQIIVKLDRKIVGTIKKVDAGWQYFPKGKKTGGEIFRTYQLVQKSLEAE